MNPTEQAPEPFDLTQDVAKVRTAEKVAKKVAWPALALAGAGVVGIAAGVYTGNPALANVGVALITASGVTGAIGWLAPAPAVEHVVEEAAK